MNFAQNKEALKEQLTNLIDLFKQQPITNAHEEASMTAFCVVNAVDKKVLLDSSFYETAIEYLLPSDNLSLAGDTLQWLMRLYIDKVDLPAYETKLIDVFCEAVEKLEARFANMDPSAFSQEHPQFVNHSTLFLITFYKNYRKIVEKPNIPPNVAESHQKALKILVTTLKLKVDHSTYSCVEFWCDMICKFNKMLKKRNRHSRLHRLWPIYEPHFEEAAEFLNTQFRNGLQNIANDSCYNFAMRMPILTFLQGYGIVKQFINGDEEVEPMEDLE
ncbi:unnamed protein product [Caenorhabditis bovis]|uniref:Uncharacterized protein n=1 Tax=Caenorhabditis bovis TaxID=2654633 RepID=A0A8S1ELX8_9PELO|nr:unnamed protein product [Caenorhabditis bovis]